MDKIKKKTILKRKQKNQCQLVLTFKTRNSGHEPKTNPIKSNP
jgi:hypothetical protein